jgi:hypothetical protein
MSSLLSPDTGDSAKIIARSLFREMKAHGYELLHMVTLLSELMELMTVEHERRAVGAVSQDRGLPAAHDESHPVSARQGAAQPRADAVASPHDER